MTSININRSLNDQFYRYKMPKLIAKVEGKGNGIKTVIVNMTDIAKALSRPPTYPTKYFGCELGSQTLFDPKKDRYIVNGQHDAKKLQEILDGFIKKYVLCSSCDNPETDLIVSAKRGTIHTQCRACGQQNHIDTSHKLNTFIMKNPPEGNNTKAKEAKTPRKDKKKKKDDSPNNSAEEGDENKHNGDKGFESVRTDGDDDDWAEDTSPEAMQKRMQELTAGAKTLMLDGDTHKSEEERINIFYKYVKEKVPVTSSCYKDLVAEAERLEIKDKAPMVLCELILDEGAVTLLNTHKQLFLLFAHDSQKAQKYLLHGIEQTIKLHQDALLPKTLAILNNLYEKDIVDEETFIQWHKKASKRYVGKDFAALIHKKAKSFITWLQNAEEETEDDSEEDAVEIEYDDRHTADGLKEVKETTPTRNGLHSNKNGTSAAKPVEDGDDDLNIDDI